MKLLARDNKYEREHDGEKRAPTPIDRKKINAAKRRSKKRGGTYQKMAASVKL